MSMMCANAACKAQKGMCNHEKIGAVVVVLVGAGLLAHFALHLI